MLFPSKAGEIEQLARQADQRRVLLLVLAINAVMFVVEFAAGVIAGSAALMADATDMFGDALVYGLSLYALGRSERSKAGAALVKGIFILLLGAGIILNLVIKLQSGLPPSSTLMLTFGALALAANLLCLRLLWRFRREDLNMASTFECSRNDVLSNVGVLLAAAAVAILQSPWPDILIGAAMAALILRSAVRVLASAVRQLSVSAPQASHLANRLARSGDPVAFDFDPAAGPHVPEDPIEPLAPVESIGNPAIAEQRPVQRATACRTTVPAQERAHELEQPTSADERRRAAAPSQGLPGSLA